LIAEIEAANEASRKESEEEARQEEILNQQKEAEKKAAEEKRRIEEEQRRADSKRRMEEYKAEFERKRAEAEANRKAQAAEQAASMKQALGLTDSKEDQELLEDAMARVQFGIEFQGARVEDMPRELYMGMLSKEIAAMRNDPHKRKLAKTAAWLNEGHIDNQSSANDVIICKACGGRYKQLGPSMINSTPTDCIKGGDHPPNWVESYDDSTVFTCPSCDGRFTSMTSGMINSTPTDCPGGGKHDPRWVPSN